MRILFITWRDIANPRAGGSEVYTDRVASVLTDRGHEVTVAAGGPIGPRRYRTIDAGGRHAQFLTNPARLARVAARQDVVVDVCNGLPFFTPLWTRTPSVLHVHHIHFGMWREWFAPPVATLGATIETKLLPRLYARRLTIAVSRSTEQALTSLGVERSRIRIASPGVDLAPTDAPRSPEPRFVVLGRLVPHKRLDLVLRAWARVRPRTGGELVIAGDGPLRAELERAAPPGTRFTGWVSDDEKQALLASSWFLVQPSRLEGWGLTVLEAAAQRTPAIGFWVPGTRDAVLHRETGLLVRTEDELVASWVELTRDAELRRVLAKGARERAEWSSWERTTDAYEAVLAEAVVRRPAPAPIAADDLDAAALDEPLVRDTSSPRALARRGLRRARRALGNDPRFLPVVLRATPLGTSRRVTRATDLVIEGFPRSGNTFAYFAVRAADPGLDVTSRVHTPSQVKRAVALGVPTLFVVRDPLACLASNLIAVPHVTIRSLAHEYVRHHEALLPLLDRIAVASFDEVTADFGLVLDAVNARFGTRFRRFEHTADATRAVFAAIDEHHERAWGGDASLAPRPVPEQAALKARVRRELQRAEYSALLAEAQTVYEAFASRSAVRLAGLTRPGDRR